MIKRTILLLATLPSFLFAQEKKMEFGASIGNNGQLDKTLNDFYFFGHETANLDDSKIDKTTNFKLSASARYFISDNISFRIKLGRAIRKDYYTNDYITTYSDYTIDHSISNISPSICFSKTIDKFELMTGIEIPLMFVGDYHETINYNEKPDSIHMTVNSTTHITMGGGFIWGINNFIGVKYAFNNWLSLGTEINYGLLFANIGDKVKMVAESTLPTVDSYTSEFDKTYRKTFFSAPEVSLGLFFRFGKSKIKH